MSVNFKNLNKLFTQEDRYNIHKILGFTSLIHFIYRIKLWIEYGNMNFDSTIFTPLSLTPHLLLSLSSLLIKIPTKRNTNLPLIYPEFRLHSIIFAIRSIIIILCIWCGDKVLRTFIVILTMILADQATEYYKNLNNGTTTRDMPNNLKGKSIIKYLYAVSQFIGTAQCIHSTRIDQIFLILIPIQVGAFLKTLARKNILTTNGVNFYYIITLLIPYIYTYTTNLKDNSHLTGLEKHIMTLFVIILRFKYNFNKYLLWSIVSLIYLITLFHNNIFTI